MNQQINLYHPIFRKEEKKFSAKTMAQAAGLILAGILLLSGLNLWQLQSLRWQLEQAERDHALATQQLAQLEKSAEPTLARRVQELEQVWEANRELSELLERDLFASSRGYSAYFVSLARQHLEGLWLTDVVIRGAGAGMTIQGRSSAPDLVPQYLQRLGQEGPLAGKGFRIFQLMQPEEEGKRKPYFEFVIKTDADEGGER